ncbi:carbonic anhydrase [Meiothermus cerbereus]|uniref:carbonic anhydrase n=1 Tax=Meiothermus cerbereus TaxID=65552 RepID=UPI003EE8BA67
MLPKPIHILLQSHNEGAIFPPFERPALAVVTCTDFPRLLEKPTLVLCKNANPEPTEPYLAFSVARRGIETIALIGHADCPMQYPYPYALNQLPTNERHIQRHHTRIATPTIGEAERFTRRQAFKPTTRLGLRVMPHLYREKDQRLIALNAHPVEHTSAQVGLERNP